MTGAVLEMEIEQRFSEGPMKTLGTMLGFLVVPGFTTSRLIRHYIHRDKALKDEDYRAYFEEYGADVDEWADPMRRALSINGALLSDFSKIALIATLAIPEGFVKYF